MFKDEEAAKAKPSHQTLWKRGWRARLNPIQQQAKDCKAPFILLDGERFSGKSIGALHALVEHCYTERDAFGLILVREVGQATLGGAWEKLNYSIFQIWKRGNLEQRMRWKGGKCPEELAGKTYRQIQKDLPLYLEPNPRFDPKHPKTIDSGIGLITTESKLDAQTKKPYVWLQNMWGGWSQIQLVSMPVEHQVMTKVKGKEPSFILVDEAQTLDGDAYFSELIQQLGRRQGIIGVQQVYYCANPAGPEHWLYKRFFVAPYSTDAKTGKVTHDDLYARFRVPVLDNICNLAPGYYDKFVLTAVKGDDIATQRMADGIWVDKPLGDRLVMEFDEGRHIRGDKIKNTGLLPVEGFPILLSYDLGAPNSSITFLQLIPTTSKVVKYFFDEFASIGQKTSYNVIVPKLIDRMRYWERVTNSRFEFIHVSDSSAFNQFRAKDGSFDAADVQDISTEYVRKMGYDDRFIIKMKACPKGNGSIEARARMMRNWFSDDEAVVSAACPWMIKMLNELPESDTEPGKPQREGRLIHIFDSASYGPFYYHGKRTKVASHIGEVTPQAYSGS